MSSPQLDSLYCYRHRQGKMRLGDFKELDQRLHKDQDYKYKRGNILEKSDKMYRYAQSFEINSQARTLIMITEDDNMERVQEFFNQSIEQIKADKKMLAIYNKADTKPLEVGITYVY